MRRAVVILGHVLILVAVIYASGCIVAAGIGGFADYTCSFSVLSRLPPCHGTSPSWSDTVVTPSPPILLDSHTRTYEKLLDESAHGAPLALNLVKAERIIVEMVNIVDTGPLSHEFKLEVRGVLSAFERDVQICQAELEGLDSQTMGLLLR